MDLFERRRKGNCAEAAEGGGLDGLSGGVPPPLADAGACDDVSALRPLILGRFHSMNYISQKLGKHPCPRPRFRFPRRYNAVSVLMPQLIFSPSLLLFPMITTTSDGCDFWWFRLFIRFRKWEWTMIDFPPEWHGDSSERERERFLERGKRKSNQVKKVDRIWRINRVIIIELHYCYVTNQ